MDVGLKPDISSVNKTDRLCSEKISLLGVTIAAKNDYCDSIDIAGSTIAILLLLWTTIAILL